MPVGYCALAIFPPTRIDETPMRLACDIYDFNKYENAGKAHVPVEQPIPPGTTDLRTLVTRLWKISSYP